MDTETRKKIIVPVIMFIAVLGINVNSIINGINQHNTSRIVIALASSLIVLICLVFLIRNAKKGNDKAS